MSDINFKITYERRLTDLSISQPAVEITGEINASKRKGKIIKHIGGITWSEMTGMENTRNVVERGKLLRGCKWGSSDVSNANTTVLIHLKSPFNLQSECG